MTNEQQIRVVYRTHEYEFSHSKSPRGRGAWGFILPNGPYGNGQTIWANGLYSDARKKAVAEAREIASVNDAEEVHVHPLP